MFNGYDSKGHQLREALISRGYWPAVASKYLEEGKYSKTVEICKESLKNEPYLLSGKIVYARALFHAGQFESASEQFYEILSYDANNIVALKYLGDIKFAENDEYGAVTFYERVLQIDNHTGVLACRLDNSRSEKTKTITLKRMEEPAGKTDLQPPLRQIPFYTETVGDLYFNQGYPRLAVEVFRYLNGKKPNPRLKEKLFQAEEKVKEKDNNHVKKTY